MEYNVAKIAVGVATYLIDKPYSYLIPEGMDIKVGSRVLVPFGKGNKKTEGIVLKLSKEEQTKGFKHINLLLDKNPIIDENMLKLAFFMQKRYFSTFYEVIKTMLPTGYFFDYEDRFVLNEEKITDEILKDYEDFISKVKIHGFVKKSAENQDEIEFLTEKEVLFHQVMSKNKVKSKMVTLYSISDTAKEQTEIKGKGASAEKYRQVVEYLSDGKQSEFSEISYVTGVSKAILNTLIKRDILKKEEISTYREIKVDYTIKNFEVNLSKEQQEVFDGLEKELSKNEFSTQLLHGITGSGKTHIYIKLIQKALENGKDSIVLMPEIALTSHLLSKFTEYFGKEVAILHSKLSVSERFDECKKVRDGKCKVVIGTRSAIFAPCKNLGLIIIDEEHESTYKSESNPRYDAREVAKYLAYHNSSLVLLASATPKVETYYQTQNENTGLFKLKERFGDAVLPEVIIYDMKDMSMSGRYSSIGELLKDEIAKNLEHGEQTILYLNRRGNSKQYQCLACGYVPECKNCSVNMTYHSMNERLMCHLCGDSLKAPIVCPVCSSRHIKTDVFGTQKIEIEINELFPNAEVLRLDADTTKTKNSHNEILEKFKHRKADILIGTQMVTKGLDFENVTLVGVIDADQALFVEDYRAREDIFAKITQVIGRAGRKNKEGRAIIQTYNPSNEVIVLAKDQQYEKFYELEIDRRKLLNLPPFCELFSFIISGTNESKVMNAAVKTYAKINKLGQDLVALGPTPARILKINNNFRYVITIRLKDKSIKQKFISHVLKEFNSENKNINIYVNLDGEC